jgi:glycerophosphoryl diester phosphodiesterase
MASIDNIGRLLSHRLRGFDLWDSTRLGLERALIAGVRHAEFDVRFTRDGHPVAYHDPLFKADDGKWHYLDEWDLAPLRAQQAISHLATLEEMCACFATFRSPKALLHVDVKVGGYESVIHDTIAKFGLLSNAVLVSWLPSVLLRFNSLSPRTRLCFSHLPMTPSLYAVAKTLSPIVNHAPVALRRLLRNLGPQVAKEASTISVYFHDNGDPASWDGCDEGAHHNVSHAVPGLLKGKMLDLLSSTHGMVCVPVRLASQTLGRIYRSQDIQLAVFSVGDEPSLERAMAVVDPDIVYVDNADVIRRTTIPQTLGEEARAR